MDSADSRGEGDSLKRDDFNQETDRLSIDLSSGGIENLGSPVIPQPRFPFLNDTPTPLHPSLPVENQSLRSSFHESMAPHISSSLGFPSIDIVGSIDMPTADELNLSALSLAQSTTTATTSPSDSSSDGSNGRVCIPPSLLQLHKCPHCSRRFASRGRFHRHVNRDHLVCDVGGCGKVLAVGHQKDLDRHKRHAHRDLFPSAAFKCEECEYKTIRKDNLKRHRKARHGGREIT